MSELNKKFDVIVVGGGFGGYTCALKCAKANLSVALIEKENIGGVCLNVGCIPTKTILKSALVYRDFVSRAENFGLEIDGFKPVINWEKILERKRKVIEKLTGGMKFQIKKSGITFIQGEAKAVSEKIIEVNDDFYECDHLVIATGSVPIKLNLPGFETAREAKFLIDSTEILNLSDIPKKLIIIGGGVIGIEFANVFLDLDTEVVVIEGTNSILNSLDDEVKKEMTKILSTRPNLKIYTNSFVKSIHSNVVTFENNGELQEVSADYCLEAIGRRPVVNGFDNIDLNISDRGAILVNDNCETNIKNVYAVGDVFGKAMLAHVAQHAGTVAAENIIKKSGIRQFKNLNSTDSIIPACIYTHPEVSMIGLTEEQLKEKNIDYKSGKYLFAANGKANASDSTKGFIKILSDKNNGKILGAHMIGDRVTELISEIALAMDNNITVDKIALTIHPHPTYSEMIGEVALMLSESDG